MLLNAHDVVFYCHIAVGHQKPLRVFVASCLICVFNLPSSPAGRTAGDRYNHALATRQAGVTCIPARSGRATERG